MFIALMVAAAIVLAAADRLAAWALYGVLLPPLPRPNRPTKGSRNVLSRNV